MLITLITINFNNAEGLSRTIESVLRQSYTDFEYIIVDGASTDGSEDIICQYESMPMKCSLKYLSETDTGIYNAMNKGIGMATGDYLLFINSGDELADNMVIENIRKTLLPATELASGGLILIDKKGSQQLLPPAELTLSYCINAGLTHPNTVIRKSLFEKYGFYNENNKIVSDWEFFLIAAGLNSCNYQQLNFNIAKFYEDGISSKNKDLVESEMQSVIKRLVPESIQTDINRLHVLENQLSHPAYKVVQQSQFIKKILTLISKIQRKIEKARR